MINQLSLSQLEHKALTDDNQLALAILSKLEDEIDDAVENATTTDDADYSYKIFDAVQACEFLIAADWMKDLFCDSKQIVYLINGLHEDTSPYNNHLAISRYKSSESWTLCVKGGQYGEDVKEQKFTAKGFKEAQEKAATLTIEMIRKGFELNI